jgi:hypothetical protein
MTDARLHSTKPIDDEVPFQDATDIPRDEEPADKDALVEPAAAERERTDPDLDVEPSGRPDAVADPGELGAP